MVKKSLILLGFFIIMCSAFGVEYEQTHIHAFKNNPGNQVAVPEAEFKQSPGQNMPASSWSGVQLRAGVECPVCGGEIVGGVCQDCGYVLGTGTGTDTPPIGDGLWILLAMTCIYFYCRKKRQKIQKLAS